MPEVRTIRYDDGRWCDQEYEGDELHGMWTVYFANGKKDWERQYTNGRQEGYQRTWDNEGRLVEEMWYHLGVLHGTWKKWNSEGVEETIGDFYFGYPQEAFQATVNTDFNTIIKPHYGLEPAEFEQRIDGLLSTLRRPSLRMKSAKKQKPELSRQGSFWNYVNVLGANEEWPHFRGEPLCPILQLNCADITLEDHPLAKFSYVTLYSVVGDVVNRLGEDIVIRAYRPGDAIAHVEPPCEARESPRQLLLSEAVDSYPDENDLPPGLIAFLKESGDREHVLDQEEKLYSRIGGWPGWLQFSRLSSYGRFALQVDSLDVESWECGDCTIHYFFLDDTQSGFSWCQEMC